MADGLYQSIIVFFIPYLLFQPARPLTENGLDIMDRMRFGAYVATPAVFAINGYIMINTYQWDWIFMLVICISDLFIFLWTGAYTSFTSSMYFYQAAAQVYAEATFWAIFFLVPIMCLFPRFAIKSLQKVYWPYDVDIIREQERLGQFDHLKEGKETTTEVSDSKSAESESSEGTRKVKHAAYGSVDEDLRPIYPPSTTTRADTFHQRSQNGSDSTGYTVNSDAASHMPEMTHVHARGRPSVDRARPSYDRVRASMDRIRPSFEASNDFTSAARLSRIESSQSAVGRVRPRLRGLSLSKSAHR